jgi:hypothetical protein
MEPRDRGHVEDVALVRRDRHDLPSSIISRVLVPLAASQIEAAVASNLDRLKRILEDTRA